MTTAPVPGVPVPYAERAREHAGRRDLEARLSVRISRFRLATFLPAAALIVWQLARGFAPLPLAAAVLLFVAFGALVVWHARVDERVAWHDALRLVNVRADARGERRWADLPDFDPPGTLDAGAHPYAVDLDLFGRASLAQWLGPAATAGGSRSLAAWLLHPAPRQAIVERQQAVARLAPLDDWRERFFACGVLASDAGQAEIDRFLGWAEGPEAFGRHRPAVRMAVLLITASIWVLFALWLFGPVTRAYWLLAVLAGIVLSFGLLRPIVTAFDRADSGQRTLGRYAALLAHAVAAPTAGARLESVHRRLSAGGSDAPASMRRLNRILGFADLRRGAAIFHFIIHALTLWDFHVFFALERWRLRYGRHVREWFEALAELDALAVLASVRRDNPGWCTPQIVGLRQIDAVSLGHPLIPDSRRVPNDVSIGPPGTLLLVTGSNMSGKSTLVRAVGLNAVLAQAGSCVCAASFSMPEVDLQSCIRVQDSLELGLSYFMAALARLKGVVDAAEHERQDRVLVYLLDEILQGTNSVERGLAVRAVVRHLLDAGAIGVMTTHDLSLAEEEPLSNAARLVHFTEIVDDHGGMRFDYRLRPGLATSRNALRLMQMIGIEL
ncbi:MAG TPA: hypothetical protein VLD67_08030 [Vicinamibacterales bacterium]|nr:hypothetical protein [Vicinamibacterales bacterium]